MTTTSNTTRPASAGGRRGRARRVRRATLLALAAALALPPGAPGWAQARTSSSPSSLPVLGDAASDDLSVSDEKRLGEQIMREVVRDPQYLDDPVLLSYLQSVWQPLVAAARQSGQIGPDIGPSFGWDVFLVRDRTVNAFALPGGHVGVHLGLITMTVTADELASVLAHELSHVTQRHIARSIGSAKRVGMVGLAAMLLGLLVASRAGSVDAAQAAVVGGQAAMAQGQLNFSRDMEREADRIGVGVLEGGGFDVAGMASMFERLEQANRLNDSGAYPYLRSHPLTSERIGEARSRVAEAPRRSSLSPHGPSPELHALMRERARVLTDTSAGALRRLQDGPVPEAPGAAVSAGNGVAGGASSALAVAYRQALASALLHDVPATRSALQRLRRAADATPLEPAVRQTLQALAVEAPLALGDVGGAVAALPALDADGGRVATLLQAQVAVARARAPGADPDATAAARRATETLQVWTADHADDVGAWTMLGEAADAAGQPLRAQRARAEARAAGGDLVGAVDLLRATQRGAVPGGPEMIELQVIDARLRTLERELRDERREARGGGR